jgi:hypothetical protein
MIERRATLPDVVERVRKGTRFTVMYRSRHFRLCQSMTRAAHRFRSRTTRSIVPNRWVPRMTGVRPSIMTRSCTHDERRLRRYKRLDGLCDRNDPAHPACTAARDATLEAGRILITTDFVVDETLTLIRFHLGLAAANAWWHQTDGSARLRWERVENDRFERARSLFSQYRVKDLLNPCALPSAREPSTR